MALASAAGLVFFGLMGIYAVWCLKDAMVPIRRYRASLKPVATNDKRRGYGLIVSVSGTSLMEAIGR